MNKKGIIAIIVIIILAAAGYALSRNSVKAPASSGEVASSTVTEIPAGVTKDDYAPVTKDSTDTTLLGKLKKASVGVSEDGTRVALVNGTATFTVAGSSVKSTVTLGDVAIEKTSGSRNDIVTTVAVANSGSINTYVVLFEDKNGGTLADKSFSLVGEGVKVTGIRADQVSDSTIDYIVSVSYTDKSAKAHTKILVVEAGIFNSAKEINL